MVFKARKEKAALWVLALHSHRTQFSTNISRSFFLQSALHRRSAAFTTCPEEGANEKSHLQRRGASKQEKKCRRVQRSCVNEWEKVRVGWPCYQLGWVGQAGRRLLSTGRDRQMLALLPGQNISPGAGSTQSGPGSCNPNDHWWRCTWPTDQSHTQWALPPSLYSTTRPSVSSVTSNTSQLRNGSRCTTETICVRSTEEEKIYELIQ